MSNSKKWSEQALIEQPLMKHDENGNDVQDGTERVLQVCVSGLNLYKKEFKDGKYKGQNKLLIPFDFIVVAGNPCPEGKFYELEYFLGKNGKVYRALIQAVNPVTDIRLIVGALRRKKVLPAEFNPQKIYLRDDIDTVCIGHCSRDEEGPVFTSGYKRAKDSEQSILDACKDTENFPKFQNEQCLEYYRGDCREIWAKADDYDNEAPIFVCGSDNVNDPAFADMRKAEMQEMQDHLAEVMRICEDYNLPYIISFMTGETNEAGLPEFRTAIKGNRAYANAMSIFLAEQANSPQ